MDNSNCYWCDYLVDKINTNEEGYYCTFNLINEYKMMEQWRLKLP